jgi:hypothetical protein
MTIVLISKDCQTDFADVMRPCWQTSSSWLETLGRTKKTRWNEKNMETTGMKKMKHHEKHGKTWDIVNEFRRTDCRSLTRKSSIKWTLLRHIAAWESGEPSTALRVLPRLDMFGYFGPASTRSRSRSAEISTWSVWMCFGLAVLAHAHIHNMRGETRHECSNVANVHEVDLWNQNVGMIRKWLSRLQKQWSWGTILFLVVLSPCLDRRPGESTPCQEQHTEMTSITHTQTQAIIGNYRQKHGKAVYSSCSMCECWWHETLDPFISVAYSSFVPFFPAIWPATVKRC